MNTEDKALKTALETWRVEPQIPPGFQREVWARIAARETTRQNVLWRRIRDWFAIDLPKPQFAVPLLVVSLSGSLALANLQAHEENSLAWKKLESRYALSFNPIAQASGQFER
jgi:hypothetical protein